MELLLDLIQCTAVALVYALWVFSHLVHNMLLTFPCSSWAASCISLLLQVFKYLSGALYFYTTVNIQLKSIITQNMYSNLKSQQSNSDSLIHSYHTKILIQHFNTNTVLLFNLSSVPD